MDEFQLTINPEHFRFTNPHWNNLMLNDPWSVGYVTTLIELQQFLSKEDWEKFYYESGQQREALISQLEESIQNRLQDEQLIRNNKAMVEQMAFNLKSLNTQYGRTRERLRQKGEILFNHIRNLGSGITLEECIECVRFRVICETWNGVIIRERNTIANLKRLFPNAEFRKVSGEYDYKYAVDYEVLKNGILVYAIQIKPKSYLWNAPYIQKARSANKQKNQVYFDVFKVPVYDIISDSKGNIANDDIIKSL